MALFLRALLFAVLLTSPNVYEFYSSQGYSAAVFDDNDEAFYLQAALNQSKFGGPQALYYEHAQRLAPTHSILLDSFQHRPDQVVGHLTYGYISKLLSLHIVEVALIADLLCSLLCYIFLAKSFYLLIPAKAFSVIPEILTVITIVFPWIVSIENFIHTDWLPFSSIKPIYQLSHSCPPILEAVESQLAATFCAYLLFIIISSRMDSSRYYLGKFDRGALRTGLIAGLSMYLYIISWIAILFIGLIFHFIVSLAQSKRFVRCVVDGGTFFLGCFLVALPGVICVVTQVGGTSDSLHTETYRSLWYFSPAWALIGAIGTFAITKSRAPLVSPKIIPASLLVAAILGELIVLNIQPLLGVSTQGLFLLLCGTRPIITFSTLVIIFSFMKPLRAQGIRVFSVISLLFVFIAASGLVSYGKKIHAANPDETSELLRFIDHNTPEDAVLAISTFDPMFSSTTRESDLRNFPNVVNTLTNRFILKDVYGLELYPQLKREKIKRELALGAFLSGEPKVSRPCFSAPPELHPISFYQPWISLTLARVDTCREYSELIRSFDQCRAFTSFKVDYVIWERDVLGEEKPNYLETTATLRWVSSSGRYQLFQIDQTALREMYCRGLRT